MGNVMGQGWGRNNNYNQQSNNYGNQQGNNYNGYQNNNYNPQNNTYQQQQQQQVNIGKTPFQQVSYQTGKKNVNPNFVNSQNAVRRNNNQYNLF